jgi:hypothetical protein
MAQLRFGLVCFNAEANPVCVGRALENGNGAPNGDRERR